MTKFKLGDRVKIVNYGSLAIVPQLPEYQTLLDNSKIIGRYDKKSVLVDTNPQWLGETGTIEKCTITQGIEQYSIIPDKEGVATAWFTTKQLELI